MHGGQTMSFNFNYTYAQDCLVTVKLLVSVSVNQSVLLLVNKACANYQYQTSGKKHYQSGPIPGAHCEFVCKTKLPL